MRESAASQEPVGFTWAGAGQSERVIEQWTHNGTSNKTTYTYGLLGPAGVDGPNDSNPSPNPTVASWIVRHPSGRPIAQRYSDGHEYYYLLDGQGNVVALEDPGTVQAAYDYCPTGNNAALPGGQLTAVGLANPVRMGAVPYDDGTKDYFHNTGCIVEDASGVCTQQAGQQYLNVPVGSNSVAYSPLLASSFTSRSGEPSNLVAQAGLTPSHPCINTNNPRFSGGLFEAGEGATQAGGGILVIGTPADPLGWAILAFGLYHVANGIVVATTSC